MSASLPLQACDADYGWRSLFVSLASPEARFEAITSRPWLLLMPRVGRCTEDADQSTAR